MSKKKNYTQITSNDKDSKLNKPNNKNIEGLSQTDKLTDKTKPPSIKISNDEKLPKQKSQSEMMKSDQFKRKKNTSNNLSIGLILIIGGILYYVLQ